MYNIYKPIAIEYNVGAAGQEGRSRGRPPNRRGRRGRLARINQNLIREVEGNMFLSFMQ